MHRSTVAALLLALAFTLAAGARLALAHDHHEGEEASAAAEVASTSGDPYYLVASPTGKPLGDTPLVEVYNGRELRFADKADSSAFHKDPEKYIAEVDTQMTADQLPFYPLEVCPVTGEPLEAPYDYMYNNRLVRFCCSGCVYEFDEDPGKFLKTLDDAAKAAQSKDYPLDHCIVLTDQKADGKHDIIVGGRLFELCCGGCEAEVRKSPAEWVSQLDAARKK